MSNMETYYGHVKTPQDAIILFEACRLGILPRVQRRLSEKERQQIRSGSVFVWDEREAGMRRWTDGKSWSASRVSGSFLTYREMEGKRGGNGYAGGNGKKSGSKGVDGKDSDQDGGEDGPDGYRYKPDGLMKQSFSITTSDGRHLHLISYYARPPANCQPLKQPTTDPLLRNVHPQKGMYPEATVNEAANIPAVTRGPMGGGPYPQAAPPVAQPYPYPPPPHGYMPYPPASWPASPAHTPPAYYAPYPPHPAYAVAYPPAPYAHPHHVPPQYAPPPGPTQFDRPPPPPAQTALPPPQSLPNGHHPPPAYAPITSPRAHSLPPYAQNGPTSALQPNPYGTNSLEPPRTPHDPPYSSPAATTSAPNGYHQQKPPTPPPSSNGVTPSEKIPELAQPPPPPLAQPPHTFSHTQTNGTHHEAPTAPPPQPPQSATPPRMLPAIHAMLNNDQTEPVDNRSDKSGSRAGSRSPASGAALGTPATSAPRPALARDIPEMMAAGGAGFQKGQTDLDKLKTQFLK